MHLSILNFTWGTENSWTIILQIPLTKQVINGISTFTFPLFDPSDFTHQIGVASQSILKTLLLPSQTKDVTSFHPRCHNHCPGGSSEIVHGDKVWRGIDQQMVLKFTMNRLPRSESKRMVLFCKWLVGSVFSTAIFGNGVGWIHLMDLNDP